MTENPNDFIVENAVVENHFIIEDAKFTIISDNGLIDIALPDNYIYNEDGEEPLHLHNFYELIYAHVPMRIIFENEVWECPKGKLAIIPPKNMHVKQHSYAPTSSDATYDGSVNFSVKKLDVKPDYSLFNTIKNLLAEPIVIKGTDKIKKIVTLLDAGNPQNVLSDKLTSSLYFHELINHIVFETLNGKKLNDIVKVSDSDAGRDYKISTIIYNSYEHDITLELLAQKMNMSSKQISRIIHSMYNCSFRELINTLRMKKAAHLLLTTEKNISSVASEVGYNAAKGFYKAFKSYYGCLPKEYRKKFMNDKNKTG